MGCWRILPNQALHAIGWAAAASIVMMMRSVRTVSRDLDVVVPLPAFKVLGVCSPSSKIIAFEKWDA